MTAVVTFGEIMLRLSPPGFERFFQSPLLTATFGGGEANVAVSLAHFGLSSYYVTRVPAHAIGEAAVRALRAEGVRTDFVLRGGERLGIYFAEAGASQRPSTVIYDRHRSSVSEMDPTAIDWPTVLRGATWFHVTGITPALGRKATECTTAALTAARAAGVRTSLDLNFRRKLWSQAEAQAVMRPLVSQVDVVMANEEDIPATLGLEVEGSNVLAGQLNVSAYERTARRVSTELGPRLVAITLRESTSASENGWSAALWDADHGMWHQSRRYSVRMVDRIGGGDAFAAGLIYAVLVGRDPASALQFAVAASALKQTIPGDFNRVSVAEVDRLVDGDASGRVQR
jgi:2-dehydro-3-deoxygluconokinase